MDEIDYYMHLRKMFVSTLLNELMPGIFHNFANPLNGIMGRSKLMQRRMDDFLKKIELHYPNIGNEIGVDYKKLMSDIDSISNESERFFDIFRVATGKFYMLGTEGVEQLNLSALVDAELRFADFYMDYKHNTRKEIDLDQDAPYIVGPTANYSIALWTLIRQATKRVREKDKTFHIKTTHDDRFVFITIDYLDHGLGAEVMDVLDSKNDELGRLSTYTEDQRDLLYALMLFKKSRDGIEIFLEDANMIIIRVPYNQ
jgi:signal transduction histidine kinase